MMIEYASSYGNDWFVVPLTLPVGSVTRVDSLVVTDTFRRAQPAAADRRSGACPPVFLDVAACATATPAIGAPSAKPATNRFFLPPTLGRSIDGAPLEDVLFMRDEMANLAWAIERTIESPIEQPIAADTSAAMQRRRRRAADAVTLPRYLLSSTVPANWIPLLPVQLAIPPRRSSRV